MSGTANDGFDNDISNVTSEYDTPPTTTTITLAPEKDVAVTGGCYKCQQRTVVRTKIRYADLHVQLMVQCNVIL
jgi:hypothetical protein